MSGGLHCYIICYWMYLRNIIVNYLKNDHIHSRFTHMCTFCVQLITVIRLLLTEKKGKIFHISNLFNDVASKN
jgi:hypothetical protein